MCGIAGFTYCNDVRMDVRETIHSMTSALTHRGPDEEGFYRDHHIALGSRRLSIIDLSHGTMPIHNEDRTLWIIFNGEIYNFPELRTSLEKKGHFFATQTDTETIVHLYEEYGVDCVSRLNGMFAFAIWDTQQQRLFLARDRLGIKPLHYVEYAGGIIFASELKAILRHPLVEAQLNVEGLHQYLSYEYVPAPHTIFKSIKKCLPGYWLTYTNNTTVIHQYWDIPFVETDTSHRREEEQGEELLSHLKESVRRRLIGDVPIGVLLSGGIDSGSIAVLASQMLSEPIHTFSIGFEESSFDETRHIQQIVHRIGSQHHQQVLNSQHMLDMIPEIFRTLDEPMADASIIPTYALAKMTSQHVKVVLSGDGADELFAGYSLHQAHKLAGYYVRLPEWLKQIIAWIAFRLPVSHTYLSFDFKVKQFLRGLGTSPEIRFFVWRAAFTEHEKRHVFSKDLWEDYLPAPDPYHIIEQYCSESGLIDEFTRILYLSMKLYMQDDILVKVDRASMAHSLEVRVPFLDHTFVEYVAGLPSHAKLRGFTTKYLLKKSLQHVLPEEVLRRKKQGFGIPLSKWFNGGLKDVLMTYLSQERITQAGIFNYPFIEKLLREHFSHQRDHRKQLWTLLVFEMWREHYL